MVSDIRAPESEGSLLNPILGLKEKKKKGLEMGPIEGKTQTLDPGKSVAGVPISLRCLPWHYRGTFKYLIFAIGWGGESCPKNSPHPGWLLPERAVFTYGHSPRLSHCSLGPSPLEAVDHRRCGTSLSSDCHQRTKLLYDI